VAEAPDTKEKTEIKINRPLSPGKAAPGGKNMRIGKAVILILAGALLLSGCAPKPSGETGTEIIEAKEALGLIESNSAAMFVDARPMPEYNEAHVEGAVNVSRADIVVMSPFPALLAPPEQIERNLGRKGISNDTLVIAYDDNNNMDAARLWWTLKVYGHDNVKVVSGGYQALQAAGANLSTSAPALTAASFRAGELNKDMTVEAREIRAHLNEPDPSVVLIDTRSEEEHLGGHIPGSIHLDYIGNNFSDGTFRPVDHIKIKYLEEGIDYDSEVWIYCHTSIRGTPVFLALYNAGYRNLRLYDGAWVEWSANPMNPVFVPETTTQLRAPDLS
jgi:thiosulfate/3-mercaptopyruvate sulfurtransferase